MGADHTIVAGRQDVVEAVKDLTAGRGADLVVEASGAPSAIAATVHMVRRLGRITAIGMSGRDTVPFPWDAAVWKVCTVIFNLSTSFTSWERAIGLIASKRIDAARLITHVAPLEDWERVLRECGWELTSVVRAGAWSPYPVWMGVCRAVPS